MKRFEKVLDDQNPADIARIQKQVKEALDSLESEDWF